MVEVKRGGTEKEGGKGGGGRGRALCYLGSKGGKTKKGGDWKGGGGAVAPFVIFGDKTWEGGGWILGGLGLGLLCFWGQGHSRCRVRGRCRGL